MNAKKKTTNSYSHLEKVIIVTGLMLVLVGSIANLYSAHANLGFIHDPTDFMYYFRYIILLGGGFAIGYIVNTKSGRETRHDRLFLGAVYAALAMGLFWLFDVVRVTYQDLIGFPPYPWGKILFMGMPLLSLIAILLTAYFSQYRTNQTKLSTFAKMAVVFSFVAYQVDTLANGAYYTITGSSTYDPSMPVWLIVCNYVTTPLVIAIVSYLFFGGIKNRLDRTFYAGLAGTFYSTLIIILWELRTDPTAAATNTFSTIVMGISIVFAIALVWRVRRALVK